MGRVPGGAHDIAPDFEQTRRADTGNRVNTRTPLFTMDPAQHSCKIGESQEIDY